MTRLGKSTIQVLSMSDFFEGTQPAYALLSTIIREHTALCLDLIKNLADFVLPLSSLGKA